MAVTRLMKQAYAADGAVLGRHFERKRPHVDCDRRIGPRRLQAAVQQIAEAWRHAEAPQVVHEARLTVGIDALATGLVWPLGPPLACQPLPGQAAEPADKGLERGPLVRCEACLALRSASEVGQVRSRRNERRPGQIQANLLRCGFRWWRRTTVDMYGRLLGWQRWRRRCWRWRWELIMNRMEGQRCNKNKGAQ